MYRPPLFAMTDRAEMTRLIADHPFAILVSTDGNRPAATHLPLLWQAEPAPWGTLIGHVATANPHWRAFTGDGAPVLAIFNGPHGYISPRWYASRRESGRVVPTWNYVAVHASGVARAFAEPERLRAAVTALIAAMEPGPGDRWRLEEAPEDYVESMLDGITGIAITLSAMAGKAKLSQNRTAEDRRGAIAGVRRDAGNPALAEAMERAFRAAGD